MATADAIDLEPGKQLPQSLTLTRAESADAEDVTVRYMLFAPKDYSAEGKKWPLLLFLHGYGESSHDNLELVKIHGPAKIVDSKPEFPFVVVTPQCPPVEREMAEIKKAWQADQLIQLVDHVAKNLNIDPERIYVTGLSMGGYGTWRLVAEYPERFAAAMPICGGGPEKMAEALATVPIWAFHGAKDSVVPVSESEEIVDAVKRAGGDVKLTVYPDVEHNSWAPTYDNPEVYEWLLAHKRTAK